MRIFIFFTVLLNALLGSLLSLGQVMVSPVSKPASLEVCGIPGEFSLLIANTTGGTMTGALLLVDLPPSAVFVPGTVSGATAFDLTNLNQPVFLLPDILNNTAHSVSYQARLECGYTNTIPFQYVVTYNSVNYQTSDPPLQNYYFASPVITGITNGTAVIPVNSMVTRDITIVQQGANASLDTLILLDQHTSDIQILSVFPGTLHPYSGPGPLRVDTIILTGSDLPGGNGKFDYGETITLSEVVKLVGCGNGQSTLKAAWGCNGEYCSFYSAFPSVSPATGNPGISLAFTSNRRSWGFIDNSGYVDFTVTNTGSGAGGTAFDVVILSGFSSGGSTYYPNGNWINKIDSFSVNGHYQQAMYNFGTGAINGQYAFYTSLGYMFDPDGSGSGLEDVDGDGYYDDLPAGKSFTLRAHTYYSWQQASTSIPTGKNCGQGWTNSAWQGFRFGYKMRDQCQVSSGLQWVPNSSPNQFMTYNTQSVQTNIPPDLYDLIPEWYEQTVTTSSAVNAEGCPADSVIYKVILPPGVIIAGGYTATFKGVSMGTPVIIGDTAVYFLDKSRILSGGQFRVPVVTKCEIAHPPTGTIQSKLLFWCDKSNWPARYFTYWCDASPVFGLQCPPGSCSDPYITRFNVSRVSLGWTNDRCTTRVTPDTPGLRLDHAMARDTVKIKATGYLRGASDSLYFRLRHNSIGGGWGSQLFFDFISDSLIFFDSETNSYHLCTGLTHAIVNGSTSYFSVYLGDLTNPGGCLAGLTFSEGDSLLYTAYGTVKNVTQQDWQTVESLRGEFHHTVSGNKIYCNDLGSSFSVLGCNYVFTASTNYQQIVLEGCNAFLYEGLIVRTLDNCGGDIGFPGEVRPFCVADTMVFTLPEGFAYQAGSATHGYFLDNGSYKTESISDPAIIMGPGGTQLTFIRTPAWGFPDYYDCWNDHDRIRFNAIPSCKATGSYSYQVNARGRYQVYIDGTGIRHVSTTTIPVTYTPPLMLLSKLVGTAEGRQDTVTWKISLCNAKSFGASNVWLGLESASNGITIVGLTDVTVPGSPVEYTPLTYGTGKKWVQFGSFGNLQCRYIEIHATYTSCDYDSLLLKFGYNCSGYPVNPELGYPPSGFQCNANTSWLYLDPKPINLNVAVTSPVNPVSLCDTLLYEVEVTNTQLAYAYQNMLTVVLPPGLSFLPGESEILFPYTSALWVPAEDPENMPAGSDRWAFDVSNDPNGVPVLKGMDSIPKNGYRLRFRLLTNCDFTSGTGIRLIAAASNACGEMHYRTSYAQPVLIAGLPTNVSLYVINTLIPGELKTCSDSTQVKIRVINLGPFAASSIEKIGITIDDAYDYSANSLTGIHNGPSGISSNTVSGGLRYIIFAIQPNLAINDSIVFTFNLNDVDPGGLSCDTLDIETTTLLVAQVSCPSAPGGSCEIQSITTLTVNSRPVVKDRIGFGSFSASSLPSGSTGEMVNVSYHVKNLADSPFLSDQIIVIFIDDVNENGIADDPPGSLLHSQVVNFSEWMAGDSLMVVSQFMVPAAAVCRLLGVIRVADNPCICSDVSLVVDPVHLVNAGSDHSVCGGDTISIGTAPIEGYSYQWIPTFYLLPDTLSNPAFSYPDPVSTPVSFGYTLQTIRSGECLSRDTAVVTVLPTAQVSAGADTLVCPLDPVFLEGASAIHSLAVVWSTAGDGIFEDSTVLHPVYTPGPDEAADGVAILTLTASGACGDAEDVLVLHLLPVVTVTTTPLLYHVCSGSSPAILLLASQPGATFSWTATAGSANVYGYNPGNGPLIDQALYNTGFAPDTVFYNVFPVVNGCSGLPAQFSVVVFPVPDAMASPSAQSVCPETTSTIMLSSSVQGAQFTWTSASSPMVTGHSGGTGSSIIQTLNNYGSSSDSVTYTITPSAFGCPPGLPVIARVHVKPLPRITNSDTLFSLCSHGLFNVALTGSQPGSSFTWIATGPPSVTGFFNGSGAVISQTLINHALTNGTVRYDVIPEAGGCSGQGKQFEATVFPVPDLWCDPEMQRICSGTPCAISLFSHVPNAGFTWTAIPSSPLISGFSAGTGNLISQTLFNSGLTGTVSYTVAVNANGCAGTGSTVAVTIDPAPVVSMTPCFDEFTTTAASPVLLKGGSPRGGWFEGQGVTGVLFSPGMAGSGLHSLKYIYRNAFQCTDTALFAIRVYSPAPFICGGILTDVRDGKQYQTSLIGGLCWMRENLNAGVSVDALQPQVDNCILEKYCLPGDPTCGMHGGLYQWDELMNHAGAGYSHGICPPGWHVPGAYEWQVLIDAISAGFPLPADGIASAFLKDMYLTPGFHAQPAGIRYLNNLWSFTGGSPTVSMFWTSTPAGPERAVARGLNDYNTSVSFYPSLRTNAFPVRCVKDTP